MKRREFLKVSGTGAFSLALPFPAVLLDKKSKRGREHRKGKSLVTIFLRGGADPLNSIVPHGDKDYYAMRPSIAIPRKDKEGEPGVLKLDKLFGFHPAMRPLLPYWESKQLAAIVNVGSPHPTRSHFEAQDFMEYAAPGRRGVTEGWLNRYLHHTADPEADKGRLRSVAMQPLLPRSLRGIYPVLATPRIGFEGVESELDTFEELYPVGAGGGMDKEDDAMARMLADNEDAVSKAGRATIDQLRLLRRILETRLVGRPKVDYPPGRFGDRLKGIAQVIWSGAGLEVASLDIPSWDHHTEQGSTDGQLNRGLTILSQGLAAFAKDLGPHLDDTIVLVMSEFGRTVRENGNRGTDHGHGGFMLALGGGVAGGQVLGEWKRLKSENLYEGRDLLVTTDFRQVFHEVLTGHFGFEPPKDFFPDYKLPRRKLGLI